VSNETRKTNAIRRRRFLETYLSGRVIDIGCAGDLVVPHAEPFDLEHGDANSIDTLRDNEAYDCVHSSHCLEHMHDPVDALRRWWKLVRPGGHMVIVVPDEDLYEQGVWPSIFNLDHKATFRLTKTPDTSWSPVSHNIETMACKLPGAILVSAERQDRHYNHDLLRLGYGNKQSVRLKRRCERFLQDLADRGLLSYDTIDECLRFFRDLGANVDQTVGRAVAQIQVVVRKRRNALTEKAAIASAPLSLDSRHDTRRHRHTAQAQGRSQASHGPGPLQRRRVRRP